MSLFEDTNPHALKSLLSQIRHGDAVLPEFQRDFVWDPNTTQELIVSIASNYPAGSLLRIRNTNQLFAFREFQGAPQPNAKPTYLILDGQQRLTSLFQAFYAVGEHRYYLDLNQILEGLEFEEAIFHLRSNVSRAKQYEDPAIQVSELILPLGVLKGGSGSFTQWALRAADAAPSTEARLQMQDALFKNVNPIIQTIDDYLFPVVTLSDRTSADAVCTIFETLNRTGVKLSVFELLTARFWPKNVNLRQLWEKAKGDYPIIDDFNVDPYYLLQIVALASRTNPSCKRGDVLDLTASTINEWWDRAVYGLALGLYMLKDDCGVIDPRWLPYNTIVNPIGAVFSKLGLKGTPQAGANRQKLVQWYWCSVFGQMYEKAPNSQTAKDTTEIIRWMDGDDPPESVSQFIAVSLRSANFA